MYTAGNRGLRGRGGFIGSTGLVGGLPGPQK